ncbi:hypothetical protein BDN70DRAFT_938231 [Pholiota conissans]|uniref:Uncharacterized protein n=1 Tax=Pholiota conissans TaxID=109636 RepID=A0A9P5YRK5_9AGAR|nr:hypothetical protein BDN70DRAFT_938231 [Pholiota conissans]
MPSPNIPTSRSPSPGSGPQYLSRTPKPGDDTFHPRERSPSDSTSGTTESDAGTVTTQATSEYSSNAGDKPPSLSGHIETDVSISNQVVQPRTFDSALRREELQAMSKEEMMDLVIAIEDAQQVLKNSLEVKSEALRIIQVALESTQKTLKVSAVALADSTIALQQSRKDHNATKAERNSMLDRLDGLERLTLQLQKSVAKSDEQITTLQDTVIESNEQIAMLQEAAKKSEVQATKMEESRVDAEKEVASLKKFTGELKEDLTARQDQADMHLEALELSYEMYSQYHELLLARPDGMAMAGMGAVKARAVVSDGQSQFSLSFKDKVPLLSKATFRNGSGLFRTYLNCAEVVGTSDKEKDLARMKFFKDEHLTEEFLNKNEDFRQLISIPGALQLICQSKDSATIRSRGDQAAHGLDEDISVLKKLFKNEVYVFQPALELPMDGLVDFVIRRNARTPEIKEQAAARTALADLAAANHQNIIAYHSTVKGTRTTASESSTLIPPQCTSASGASTPAAVAAPASTPGPTSNSRKQRRNLKQRQNAGNV